MPGLTTHGDLDRSFLLSLGVLTSLALAACGDPAKRPLGSACDSDGSCVSGMCAEGTCIDPAADDDQDQITNGLEVSLGSNPFDPDTDHDGRPDGDELDDALANVDTDGDGKADVVESAVADPDQDCIPDQYDAENDVANSDLSPMLDVVCSTRGVCEGQRAHMAVTCPAGTAICVYTDVPGWEDPETKCDSVDQNCDGAADESFPDRDADHIANCVDDDWDNDGVVDGTDVCPALANPDQADADADGVGDLCVASYGLFFVDSPVQATVGVTFDVAVGIAWKGGEADRDAPLPPFHGAVKLTLDGHGVAATLSGTDTAAAGGDGVAHFTGLGIDKSGSDMTLVATSGGLAPADSTPFDVQSGALASFRVEGLPAEMTAGVSVPFAIIPLDGNDNEILDYEGMIAISATDPEAALDGMTLGEAPYETAFAAAPGHVSFLFAGDQALTVTEVGGTATGTAQTTVRDAGFAALRVAADPSTVAGVATDVTVQAEDAFGNVAIDYTGTVTLTSDDANASLAPSTIDFGAVDATKLAVSSATLRTAGARVVTATDAAAEVSGAASLTVVPAAAARLGLVPSAVAISAGAAIDVDVTAYDAYDNVATGFTGVVALTCTDAGATIPEPHDFAAGDAGHFRFGGLGVATKGTQTITATGPSGVTGAVDVEVAAGGIAVLDITAAPTTVVAGDAFTIAIELRDAEGNVVPDDARTIHVDYGDGTSEDVVVTTGAATLSGLDVSLAGAHTVTLGLVGTTIADHTAVVVNPATASRLTLTAPASVVAGVPHDVTVTAYDRFDNVATGYRGTVTFTTSDAAGTAAGDFTFTENEPGTKLVSGTVGRTAGKATVTVRDAAASLSASTDVTYVPASAARLDVTGLPATTTAGQTLTLTVTAYDAYDNVATGYTGTVELAATDLQATLPASHTLTSGVYTFGGLVLATAGNVTVTARDPVAAALRQDVVVRVDAATATHLDLVLGAATLAAGITTSAVVTARDAYGNVADGYRGTVHFTSTDGSATLPTNYPFVALDKGEKTFGNITFRTVGTHTVTATDIVTASIAGSDTIEVQQGADIVYRIEGAPTTLAAGGSFGFTLRVEDTFGNAILDYAGKVHLSSDDGLAILPADYQFTGGEGGTKTYAGVVLKTSGSRRITATDAADARISTSAIVDVTPGSMSTLELGCSPPTPLRAGDTFSCNVRARDSYGNLATAYRGTVTFTSTDAAATLPDPTPFGSGDAGSHTFTGIALFTSGTRTITVADGGVKDNASFTVAPAGITSLALTPESATPTAGTAFYLDVRALDRYGNTQSDFSGAVAFTMPSGCDAHANATLVNGTARVTGFRCTAAGVRSLQAATTEATPHSGTVDVTVKPAGLDHFAFTPSTATPTAGATFDIAVSPRDVYDNVAPHNATMTFALPSGCDTHADATINGDTTVTGFRCTTTGSKTVSGTSGGKSGSTTVNPTAAGVASFVLTPSTSTPTAGATFDLAVSPRDAFNNLAPFTGTMAFTMPAGCDAHADAALSNDTTVTGFRCTTTGSKSITGTAGGKTGSTSVSPAPAAIASFTLTPSTATPTAGVNFDIAVSPRDQFNNTITTYSGSMTWTMPTGCDAHAAATVSGDTTVTAFRCTASGSKSITGTASTKTGSTTVTVGSAALASFVLTPSTGTPTAGATFDIAVSPRDQFNNVTTYSGTMAFTVPSGCDAHADAALTNATTVTGFRCTTTGSKSITGTASTKSGTATVSPTAAALASFSLTPSSSAPAVGASFDITISPRDQFNNVTTYNGTMTFTMPQGCDAHADANLNNDTTVTAFRCTTTGSKTITGTASTKTGTTIVNPGGGALASFVLTPSTATPTAGATFDITVSPRDAFNNTIPYSGSMTFTMPAGCDAHADANLSNDTVVSGFRCTTATSKTITGTSSAKTGTTSVTPVPAAIASFTLTPSTSGPTAGAAFTIDVSPRDQFDNTITTYTGTMVWTMPAGCAAHADTSISGNTTATAFTCTTTGAKSITGTASTKTGSTSVTPVPAAIASFVLTPSTTTPTAGAAFSIDVSPRDTYSNIITGYTGTMAWTMPAGCSSHADSALSGVTTVTGFTCTTTGSKSITGTSSTKTGSTSVSPTPAGIASFTLTPSTTGPTAGATFSITVSPRDTYGNTITTYAGTMAWTMPAGCDAHADAAISGDTTVASFRCTVASAQSITGTASTKTGTTSVTPVPAAIASFALTPSTTGPTAGASFTIDVSPRDAFNNTITTYTGTMVWTMPTGCASHADAAISGNTTVTAFSCTTTGSKTITGTASTKTGTTSVTPVPAGINSFTLTSQNGTPTAGSDFAIDVTPLDVYNNTITTYTGTMTFTMPTGCATHANASISGVTTVSAFNCTAAGSQSISGTASTKSGSTSVTVQPAGIDHFTLTTNAANNAFTAGTSQKVTVTPQDKWNNTVTTYSGNIKVYGTTGACTDIPSTAMSGVTIVDFTCQLVSGVKITADTTPTATYTGSVAITVSPAGIHHYDLSLASSPVYSDVAFGISAVPKDIYTNTITSYSATVTFALTGTGSTTPAASTLAGPTTSFSGFKARASGTQTLTVYGPANTPTSTLSVPVVAGCVSPGAGPATMEWKTQPTSGYVNETLPSSQVQLKDAYGNVCANLDGRTVSVKIGTNPSQGILSGTLSTTTVAGVATFSALKINQRGTGYTLVGSSGALTAITSNAFNVTWSQPAFVGTPTVSSGGGCTTVAYTVSQAGSGPVNVAVSYDAGASGTGLATPLGTTLGEADGLVALTTSATGVAHSLIWDNFADLGPVAVATTKLTLSATVPGGTPVSVTTSSFAVDAAWTGTFRETAYTQAIAPGKPALGDMDLDGIPDLVVPDTSTNGHFTIMWGRPDTTFLEGTSYAVDLALKIGFVAVGDVDGDGDRDVALTDTTGANVTILKTTVNGSHSLSFSQTWSATPCASNGVTDVAMADFNADGRADVAFACSVLNGQVGRGIRFWYVDSQSALTQLAYARTDSSATTAPSAISPIDFDLDGYTDVAIATGDKLLLTKTTSAAAFTIGVDTNNVRSATNMTDVATGDLDRDGAVDIAYTTSTSGSTTKFGVFFGKGTGSIDATASTFDVGRDIDSLEIGDVDQDGRPDVAAGSVTKDLVALFRSKDFRTAGSSTETKTYYNTGSSVLGPNRVFIADVSHDGRSDIAFTRTGSGAARSAGYIAGGPTRWCEPKWTAPRPAATADLLAQLEYLVDLNKDGKLDLVQTSQGYADAIEISYGRGDGTFETAPVVISLDLNGQFAESPTALAFGDFDSDGKTDIMVMIPPDTGLEGAVRWYRQASETKWSRKTDIGTGKNGLVAADFDLDGDVDVARMRWDGTKSYIQISLQTSAGVFSDSPTTIGLGSTAVALGMLTNDLNRDGTSDFIVKLNGSTTDVCVVASTGSASWPTTLDTTYCISSNNTSVVSPLLDDITGDGRADLVYAGTVAGGGTNVYVRTFDTNGKFSAVETYSLCSNLRAIAAADFDGKNGDDLAIVCNATSSLPGVQVFPQSGTATRFAAATYVGLGKPYGEGSYQALAVGDLDGGYPDVVLQQLAFHNQATTLAFDQPAAKTIAGTSRYPTLVDLTRYNADDSVDIVSAWSSDNAFTVASQTAAGDFSTAETAVTSQISAMATGEFSGDARPDVAVTAYDSNYQGYRLRFFRRAAGAATATEATSSAVPATASFGYTPDMLVRGAASYRYYSNGTLLGTLLSVRDGLAIVGYDAANGLDRFQIAVQGNAGAFTLFPSTTPSGGNLVDTVVQIDSGILQAQSGFRAYAVGGVCSSAPCIKVVGTRMSCITGTAFICTALLDTYATLTISATYNNTSTALSGLGVGDLDHDGRDDILVAFDRGATGTELVAYLQNADGSFTEKATGDYITQGGVTSLQIADIDQDGWLDAVATVDDVYATSVEVLYLDGGSATFGFRPDHSFVASGRNTGLGLVADMCQSDSSGSALGANGRPDFVTVEPNTLSARILLSR